MSRTDRMKGLATVASSLLIPFPLLVSAITRGVLFSGNPAGVDITNGLAYLRELLGFGFGSLGLILIVIGVVFVVARRAGASLRLPWTILLVQIVVGALTLAFTALSNNALDTYVG
ncbi:MAG: hypothetical protein J0J03_06300 [Leifsonia sp.]|nr:hypothetical protein [Leifsonia sp.]